MTKIKDMPDEQIAGFFYLALWNDEISKVLASYPNATPVDEQTGPTGFYLWRQNFGYLNAAASDVITNECVDFISNYFGKYMAADNKITSLTQKLPLLKHYKEQHFNEVLLVWFGRLAIVARQAKVEAITGCLELFYSRIDAYVTKCSNTSDTRAADIFMPALINVMLRHLQGDRLNFIKATMAISFFDKPRKNSILNEQSIEHRQAVLDYIKNTSIIKANKNDTTQGLKAKRLSPN